MKKILLILIVIFFLSSTLFYLYVLPSHNDGIFKVKKGETLNQITKNLKKEGFIKFGFPFYFYVLAKGKDADLKFGAYLLTRDDSVFDIANKIIAGETTKIKVTIPEGFNLNQIEKELREPTGLTKIPEELLKYYNEDWILDEPNLKKFRVRDFKDEFNFLKDAPADASLEGFLFPSTYYFYPGQTREEIIRVFLGNFNRKLTPELRKEAEKQGRTIFEIVTMASLLEEEVRTLEDKKLASGILWKRLENNWPLQVDATITYITGRRTIRISLAETKIDSPYNTYKYLGLPIGPISNPGLNSILAALNPVKSDFWFYLSALDGRTIFSKTYEEHNLAIAKYLR